MSVEVSHISITYFTGKVNDETYFDVEVIKIHHAEFIGLETRSCDEKILNGRNFC
jgi:hypothetical protein